MSEQQGREVITLTEAAEYIGRTFGVKPSVATVWRWARKGLKGHRLPIISIGRRCRTTTAAVREFIERLSTSSPHGHEHRLDKPVATSSFTREQRAEAERQRDKEVADAKRQLRQYTTPSRTNPSKKESQGGNPSC